MVRYLLDDIAGCQKPGFISTLAEVAALSLAFGKLHLGTSMKTGFFLVSTAAASLARGLRIS
jgi:predicted exporter